MDILLHTFKWYGLCVRGCLSICLIETNVGSIQIFVLLDNSVRNALDIVLILSEPFKSISQLAAFPKISIHARNHGLLIFLKEKNMSCVRY